MDHIIYTHDLAAKIVELFEDLLDENGVKIPSPEDSEREDCNGASVYGSVYCDLLDEVEHLLVDALCRAKSGASVIPYRFSGNA